MPDCFAKNCRNRKGEYRKNQSQLQWENTNGIKISFHRIPTNPKERKKWLDGMQLNDSEVPKNACFCSCHFEEANLDRTSTSCVRLKPGAFPHNNVENSSSGVNPIPAKRQKLSHDNFIIIKDEICIDETSEMNDDAEQGHIKWNCSTLCENIQPNCSTPRQQTVQLDSLDDTPRERMLRIALKNTHDHYKKKIRILQQKQRRTMKCVARLKDILKSLKQKNLLQDEKLDVLEDLGTFNNNCQLKRQE